MCTDNSIFNESDEIPCFHTPDYKLTMKEMPKYNKLFYGIFISNQTFEDMDKYKEQKIYEILMIRRPKILLLKENFCKVQNSWCKVIRPHNIFSSHTQYIETEIPIYWRYK